MTLYTTDDFIAFENLYARHADRVFSYLRRHVDVVPAEELLQDVFFKLHKYKSNYAKGSPFLPWMFTIARRTLIDHYKKNETRIARASDPLETSPEPVSPEKASNSLTELIQSLPEEQKHIFERRYLQDWSFEDIAREMMTSPENIRQRVSRGLKKLRAQFISKEAP